MLTPNNGNLHCLYALETCVMFDILMPGYDMKDRWCHYYEIQSNSNLLNIGESVYLKQINEPKWLIMRGQKYNGPPVEDIKHLLPSNTSLSSSPSSSNSNSSIVHESTQGVQQYEGKIIH
jgi:hypothetical protein